MGWRIHSSGLIEESRLVTKVKEELWIPQNSMLLFLNMFYPPSEVDKSVKEGEKRWVKITS